MVILIGGIVLLILVALALSGKLRVLIKGFFNLFVEDLAKTPEGAKAVYTQAIEKAQNDYNAANNNLQKIAGQLDTEKRNLVAATSKLKSTEEKCEQFVQAGQFDKAELYAQEREQTLEDLDYINSAIKNLTPYFEQAKQINNALETKLVTLKKDKDRVVNEMKLNTQLKGFYDDLNELKNTTDVDKLLTSVKEGSREKREVAVGAGVVHNNRHSTKIDQADQEAKKLQNNSYLEELKKKHGK